MENYICINGKKAELTEEQIKTLGIELPSKTLFSMESDELYYFISSYGNVIETTTNVNRDVRYNVANYCTDKALMKQRALHETLNRLLWRYSMEHGGAGNFEIAWSGEKFIVQNCIWRYTGETFKTYESADAAIEEIIKPFIKEHPDFKW